MLTKLVGLGDIRKIGSGNIGATNVLRTGKKGLAALTLILDASKGALPASLFLLITYAFPITEEQRLQPALLAGLFAVLGHCFPIWLKFKGGKGVATALGVLLAAVPYTGLAACAAWLITAFTFKYSSLAALAAIGIAPVVTFFVYGSSSALICALITLLVWGRHHANIKRLLKGEEPKIGSSKKPQESDAKPSA